MAFSKVVVACSNALFSQAQAHAEILALADRETQVEMAQRNMREEQFKLKVAELEGRLLDHSRRTDMLLSQTNSQEKEIERLLSQTNSQEKEIERLKAEIERLNPEADPNE